MTKGCFLMWLSVSSWLLWSQNDFSHLHVLFLKWGGVCRGREVWCVLGTDLAPLDVWCIYFCWSLCIGWYLSTTANPNPHQQQCQHFYLGVVIREYNLFGKADVILYKTEKTQLSKLKNERGEDLRLWRRVKPEPPPGSPGGDITLHVLGYLHFRSFLSTALPIHFFLLFFMKLSFVPKLRIWSQKSNSLGSNSGSFAYWLFDLGQMIYSPHTLVCSAVEWA